MVDRRIVKAYQLTEAEVITALKSDPIRGLSSDEVQQRHQLFGLNVMPEPKQASIFTLFFSQFSNPLIYILLIAATIIFFSGNRLDAFIISGVLFFNAVVGTVQEGRTQTLLNSLRRLIKSNAVVLRDGKRDVVDDSLLCVGDIVILQEGSRVPADIRLIHVDNLQSDEAVLTGESVPVKKTTHFLIDALPIHDQKNMVFRGTHIVDGFAKGVVIAIGQDTEIGRLQKVAERISTDMPLRRELDHLSHKILLFILGMCGVLFGIGWFFGRPLNDLLTMLTALFICVVPEGLPVVLTLVLVTGAYRMAKQQVLVKRLQGVDTLGRAEVFIIDKTGTLTRNEMMASYIYVPSRVYRVLGEGYDPSGAIVEQGHEGSKGVVPAVREMGVAGFLLHRSHISFNKATGLYAIEGDPTDAALFIFGQKCGLVREQVEPDYNHQFEIPFSPSYAYHAAFYEHGDKGIAFVIGAPEVLADYGARADDQGSRAFEWFLSNGLRVVAVAKKTFELDQIRQGLSKPEKDRFQYFQDLITHDMQFVGYCALQDAIRADVAPMITRVRAAGQRVIMATGDHRVTALFVAKDVGIFTHEDEVLDGTELDQLSESELIRRLEKTTVYARVTPEQKLRVIRAFRRLGAVVAMTGDGVNDAPALVAADIGIAMGGGGTEVAKEAADVVLLDNSFANIVHAVEQGRHILYALRRVILYFFATNMGEVFVVLLALALNVPLPILAAQILWLNLVTDGFLDMALAMEPMEKGLLEKRFLKRGSQLVDTRLLAKTVYMAIPMGIGSMVVFLHYYQTDLALARTMTLVTMAMYQWFNAWNCRSETKSIFTLGLFNNGWLVLATTVVALLQVAVTHISVLQTIFHTVPLSMQELGVIVAVTMPLLVIEEVRKLFVRLFFVA